MKPGRGGLRRLCARLVLVPAVLPACGVLSAPPVAAQRAMLTALPSELPRQEASTPHAPTLRVATQTRRAYDTTRMAYMLHESQVAYFRDHEWAETPSEMLQPLLASALQGTGRFAAVLVAPAVGRADYLLQARVVQLVQDFTGQAPAVRLALHVQLSGNLRQRAASTDIQVREPMAQRTPEAGVAAANRATARALQETVAFALKHVAE